eukprot:TRINITY_DN61191_c0_g1_i1.p1 TRINITY_DN61191_c0_g1~~TRINITY_DN61191_c0_g1_i1.p1  ORF type:complete len:236 (+),score=51.12 TRINITY_DN61191_c0_g1_i1:86-709(+)
MAQLRHSPEELTRLRQDLEAQLAEEAAIDHTAIVAQCRSRCAESGAGDPSATFALAVALVRSGTPAELEEARAALNSLSYEVVCSGACPEFARALGLPPPTASTTGRAPPAPEVTSEARRKLQHYCYYIALATYKLGESAEALAVCERMLELDPNHRQAIALHALCTHQLRTDELKGAGMAAASAVAGIIGLGLGVLAVRAARRGGR